MIPHITNKQLQSAIRLVKNLNEFEGKGFGKISNLIVMTNAAMPNTIFIKYEKNFIEAGEAAYEFRIASIGNDGVITFIDDKFNDIFARANFLGECKPLDIAESSQYELID